LKISAKNVGFLVSSEKNKKCNHFSPPLEKIMEKSFRVPLWKTSCDAHVYEAFVDMVEF